MPISDARPAHELPGTWLWGAWFFPYTPSSKTVRYLSGHMLPARVRISIISHTIFGSGPASWQLDEAVP